jgi:hypothetical protein
VHIKPSNGTLPKWTPTALSQLFLNKNELTTARMNYILPLNDRKDTEGRKRKEPSPKVLSLYVSAAKGAERLSINV